MGGTQLKSSRRPDLSPLPNLFSPGLEKDSKISINSVLFTQIIKMIHENDEIIPNVNLIRIKLIQKLYINNEKELK
jgi:hypothetical protein